MAGGSVTITEELLGSVKHIKFDCTTGVATSTTITGTTTGFYNGKLIFFVTVPGTSGDAPTDNYNVTVVDKNSVDLLAENGLTRATGTAESILDASLGAVANSQLTISVAAAGSANTTVAYVWIR